MQKEVIWSIWWHIGLPIYWHFVKYQISVSVKVRTNKISVMGYPLWPNIDSEYRLNFGVVPPDISVKHRYIGIF